MSNRFASFDTPHAPVPLHRYGGRVQATRELAISPVAGDLFVVDGVGPVYALPPGPRGPVITLLTATAITFVHSSKLQLPGSVNLLSAANDALLMAPVADGGWQCIAHLRNGGYRERLTANRSYYVRTDGNDSNDGLNNDAAGAFLTIQKACDVVAALDRSIYTVTVNIGGGTFGGCDITGWGPGSRTVAISGAGMASTTINTTGDDGFNIVSADVTITGVKIQTTTSGSAIRLGFGALLHYGSIDFGAVAHAHIWAEQCCRAAGQSNYTISGGGLAHFFLRYPGASLETYGLTLTLSGTPAFSVAYAYAVSTAMIEHGGCTFTGSATGPRYFAATNGVLSTSGGGASYLPGNSAGSVATGGQYI